MAAQPCHDNSHSSDERLLAARKTERRRARAVSEPQMLIAAQESKKSVTHSPHPRGVHRPQQASEELKNTPLEQAAHNFALPSDHPVSIMRDLSRALYGKLDEFVENHLARPSQGFGFSAKPVPPVQTEGLLKDCTVIVQAINAVIKMPALDPLTVRAQDIAKDLKVSLQGFRQMLAQDSFQGGVPEVAVVPLVEQTMMFQRVMSDQMNDLTSLSYGVSVQRSPQG